MAKKNDSWDSPYTKDQIEEARELARFISNHYELTTTVHFCQYPEDAEMFTTDYVWDKDGDGIFVETAHEFHAPGTPPITVSVAQGSDHRMVARVLRKIVNMLESPSGYQLMNITESKEPGSAYYADRLQDGSIDFQYRD